MAFLNRVKTNTATTGTGAVTPGAAVSAKYQTWAAAGASNGQSYPYLIEQGNAWEVGTGPYDGTTIARPGPGVDSTFESSTGALLVLDGTATIAQTDNKDSFGGGAAGALTLLQTVEITTAVANVDLTQFDAALYNSYTVTVDGLLGSVAGQQMWARCSSDGGATFDSGNNYNYSGAIWGSSGFSTGYQGEAADHMVIALNGQGGAASTYNTAHRLQIGKPNVAQYKAILADGYGQSTDDHSYRYTGGAAWSSTATLNALRFYLQTGNMIAGIFKLYGLS